MKARLLLGVFVFVTFHAAFAQKAVPLGATVVLPTDDPNLSSEPCWKDPNILGVVLRLSWSNIETRDGYYDWIFFIDGIQLAQANGKWVVLSVDGSRPPEWVYKDGVPQWKSSAGKRSPYPWNATLQSKWSGLVAAMGSQYDGQTIVHGVTMWVGGTAIESFFAVTSADAAALDLIAGGGPGSGAGFWENAAKVLITDFVAAFPNTPLYLATGVCYPDSDATMTDLVNWYTARSILVSGAQSDALQEYYPAQGIFPHTTLSTAQLSPIMYQELAAIGNPRMKGATLAEVIARAEKANAKAIQVYPSDPPTDEGSLAAFNTYVGAD